MTDKEFSDEDYLTLKEATRLWMPSISYDALFKYARTGMSRSDGTVVTLRTTKSGGRRYTTAVWVEEFKEATKADF